MVKIKGRKPPNRGTAAKFPSQGKSNKPVKSILKKKYVPKVEKNKEAIMTLSRQVRSLQNQRLGEVQTHTQFCNLAGDSLPLAARPILFGVNNFYDQDVYGGTQNQGIASYNTVGTFARQTYRSDLNDEYEWNANRNSDTVSAVEYKPIYTRLNFQFSFASANIQYDPRRVRITILKVKPYQSSNKLSVALPQTLGAYRWLAIDPTQYKNYLDKKYHTVLFDRWVSVRKPDSSVGSLVKEVRIDWKYPRSMVLKPDITSSPAGQNFWTNTKESEQIWCLLSTDADNSITNVKISKFDVWRDPHGV